eukprot:COSAG02_NODE_311_length_24966_cov_1089.426187_14_plen_747_part_00
MLLLARQARPALLARPARPLRLASALRGAGGGGAAAAAVQRASWRAAGWQQQVCRSASSTVDGTGSAADNVDRGRARQLDLAEALADLDELVGTRGSGGSLGGVLGEPLETRDAAADEQRGAEELTDLLAMVRQRDQPEEAAEAEGEEWGAAGGSDLSDSSRDALTTSVRSRTRAELSEALRQEEIEDARARYNKKRWARNWVVKRTTELHRRKADAAEVEQAIQEMITRGDLPTVVTYNTLIAACGRSKSAVRSSDAKRAYSAFVEMKRRGLVPTASTYSTLLTTLSQSGSSGRLASTRRRSSAAARVEAVAGGEFSFLTLAFALLSLLPAPTTRRRETIAHITLIADDMFEKVWLEMAQYLSDHARGLVDMKERDRTVLCNSALNASLRRDEGQEYLGRGRGKFTQMREYMRAHGVVHDAVGYTLLVRVAKDELDEAVRETELVANRSRQQQLRDVTRAEGAAATAAAAAAERRAALALRNLLNLWMTLGLADARVQAAGKTSMLDSRLTNGLLAALASAARLVDVDPLALTATIGEKKQRADAGHNANEAYQQHQQRDVNIADDEPVEPEVDASSLDFELGYDLDDSSPKPSHVGDEYEDDSDDDDSGDEDGDDDDYDDEDMSFGYQSTGSDDSDSEDSSGRWVPRSGFGEERRARQRKAIVAMSWQLWSTLQLQIGARAAAKATHSDGSSNQDECERRMGRNQNQNARREARKDEEEREGVAHVLSTLTSVMLRAGDAEDQG